jgi:hypothetical protein
MGEWETTVTTSGEQQAPEIGRRDHFHTRFNGIVIFATISAHSSLYPSANHT